MKVAWPILLAMVVAGAAPIGAKTFVVDPNGTGDFTTIQAAIDTLDVRNTIDTIVVHAGHYPEHLNYRMTEYFPHQDRLSRIVCPSGPDSTTALDFTCERSYSSLTWWVTRGLGFTNHCVTVPSQHMQFNLQWEHCAFFAGYESTTGQCTDADVSDCDFYAATQLMGYRTTFTNLRFHHAPLTTTKLCGDLRYVDCTFVGEPGDVLVTASGEDTGFDHCVFDTGAIGYSASPNRFGAYAGHCQFRNLDIGVRVRPHDEYDTAYLTSDRFDHCRQAVVSDQGRVTLVADTLVDCGDRAVVASAATSVDGLVFERIDGDALDLTLPPVGSLSAPAFVRYSVFRDVAGTALRIGRLPGGTGGLFATVEGNRFERCDTAAVVIASGIAFTRNLAFANDGAGIVATFTATTGIDSIAYNTIAFNLGDGVVVGAGTTLPPGLVVARNVSAQNGGAGFRIGPGFAGTFANNDAWQNYGAEYAGLVPNVTNLTLDPLFCDLVNGDLTVSYGSPCAPGAVTGPIGALGVGCGSPAGVSPLADAASLSARPNPARGVVTFALPGRVSTGALEVLDVQGRRVWRAPIDAGAMSVQWRGEREGGTRAGAGIYWVRVQRDATPTQTKRFIWLD